MPIGAMVTLRGERMYEFLDRLISIALPRVRDFRGVSPKGFDGRGNFTLGLKDQLMFPEIDYMKVDKARGMNVSVVTTAKTDEEARKLLQLHRHAVPHSSKASGDEQDDMATTAKIAKEAEDAEVHGPAPQPLPAVRPPAGLHAEVRAVPPVLPQAGARRRRRRRDEEQLVRARRLSQTIDAEAGSGILEAGREQTMTDPIADMLTRIRNATIAQHTRVDMPASQAQGGDRADPGARRLHPGLQVSRADGRASACRSTIRVFAEVRSARRARDHRHRAGQPSRPPRLLRPRGRADGARRASAPAS